MYQVIWSWIVTMRWPGVVDEPSNPHPDKLVSIFSTRAFTASSRPP
jgi:hypothetical protein